LPPLITTDEYAAYYAVIVSTYGARKEDLDLTGEEKAELGWGDWPPVYFPVEICYATVHKDREQGRVVRVRQRVVLGTDEQAAAAVGEGGTVNASYVERWNGTQRHFNARKARRVCTFSKDLVFHIAATWLCVVAYNFTWQPRTLRERVQESPPRHRYRTPAMAAGLTTEPWSLERILTYPLHRSIEPTSRKRRRRKRVR
jgi:hypothetical protein